jgi:CBS domain-containing protein
MNAGTIFNNEVITAAPSTPLSEIAQIMADQNVGTVVITENQKPVGIITDRDLGIALGALGLSREAPVERAMSCPVMTIGQHEGIYKATQYLMENATRRLPVVDAVGRLVGIVSADDLILLLTRELQNVARGIRTELATA